VTTARWDRSAPAAIATLLAGLLLGSVGFLSFAERSASAHNEAMLEAAKRQADGALGGGAVVSTAPVALNALAPFLFALTTPLGWLATYLLVTGGVRCVAAAVDDPRGDPLVDLALYLRRRGAARRTIRRAEETWASLAGPEVSDRLTTAGRFGIDGADLVVVASRRHDDWTPGTVLDCGERYYRVGAAVERTLPGGLRTLYPLTELPASDVFRRVVRYDLPRIQPDPPGN